MAYSFIKMNAIGNIGKELKFNTLPSGTAVLNFSIASTDRWKDRTSGQPTEKTTWLDCVAYGKLAEVMHQFLKPGARVYLAGDYTVNEYVNASQVTVKSGRMEVSDFTALDKSEHTAQAAGYADQQNMNQAMGYNQPQQQNYNQQPQQNPRYNPHG